MRSLFFIALLAGCTPGSEDPEDTGPPPVPLDPDVASWSPDFAPLPAVGRVIYLGDSVTAGYGIANQRNTYTELLLENNDDRWPDFVGDELTSRYGELEIVDVSRSGAQTADIVNLQIPNMEAELGSVVSGPTLVIMTIGGNDITGAMGSGGLDTIADEVEANIEAIAQVFTDPTRFPDGSLMLLANVYEPTDGAGQADQCFFGLDVTAVEPILDDINGRSLALAQDYGFAWVDIRGHFRGHGWNYDQTGIEAYDQADPTLWFQEDCIHPNKRGHHELRRLFLAAADNEPLTLWQPEE